MTKKRKQRFLHVTMTDGSVWEVPVSVIAQNREDSYRAMGENPDAEDLAEDLRASWFEEHADDYAITDWAENNMNWDDVADVVKRVQPPPAPEFQESWVNGKKEVVRR